MRLLNSTIALAVVLSNEAFSQVNLARAGPEVILEITQENQVQYVEDIADPAMFATAPGVTPPKDTSLTFKALMVLADIVAINGQPVKGTTVIYGRRIPATPTPGPKQAIADAVFGTIQEIGMRILTVDSREIGTIMLLGLGLSPTPPGAPLAESMGHYVIVGGSGAFLGVRGELGQSGAQDIPVRLASMVESPANRRANGGGRLQTVAHLIPMMRPEVVSAFHSNFSPVTSANPAKAGEVLIAMASGMGPTRPGVDPGQPFPSFPANPLQQINSPVDVTVNDQSASVSNAVGWPGLVDRYRVDFQVPAGTASGMATVQLSAAWISGLPVSIPIQ